MPNASTQPSKLLQQYRSLAGRCQPQRAHLQRRSESSKAMRSASLSRRAASSAAPAAASCSSSASARAAACGKRAAGTRHALPARRAVCPLPCVCIRAAGCAALLAGLRRNGRVGKPAAGAAPELPAGCLAIMNRRPPLPAGRPPAQRRRAGALRRCGTRGPGARRPPGRWALGGRWRPDHGCALMDMHSV